MGGAGATTIGFHHPDRFATVTSFFGDSRYDLSTYVRSILVDEAHAHRVNALDVVDNARNLPVWLIHGTNDATSPIRQSEILASAMQQRGFHVRFDRVPDAGHSGALVARFLPELVALAATAETERAPSRVTYRSVRTDQVEVYDVLIEPDGTAMTADTFVDLERRADGVHVLRAEGVASVALSPGAMGTAPGAPPAVVVDDPRHSVRIERWTRPRTACRPGARKSSGPPDYDSCVCKRLEAGALPVFFCPD